MVDVKNIKCITAGCGKIPLFGVAGTKTAEYYSRHAPDELSKSIAESVEPEDAVGFRGLEADSKMVEYCAQHTPVEMVNVKKGKCRTEGCRKGPYFGVAGTKTTVYCLRHAPDGMVDVHSKNCITEGCGKRPSYGVAGTKTAECCVQHAPDGMVDVKNNKCKTEECVKVLSLGVTGTKMAEWSTSRAENVKPKDAAYFRRLEWPVQTR